MPSTRELQVLPVPAGAEAVHVRPALERVLNGRGPALLPVNAKEPATAARLASALGAGEELNEDPATALVIATSGSTGTPKGVLLTASALRASANATHQRLGGPGSWLLSMPAHHIAGIQVLVRSLVAGTAVTAVDTTQGFRNEQFIEAAQQMPRSDRRYTALVPTQLARLLADDKARSTLCEFDAVLIGGAAAPAPLLAKARDYGVQIVTTYGMSETSGGCVYDGRPLDGVEVRLGTGDDEGMIFIAGPVLASGYRRSGSEAFTDGWFRTNDLGQWRDGRLSVLGRADDVIITGGVNVAPGPIEHLLAAQPCVRDVCVVGVDDPEWGEVVTAAVVPDNPSHVPDTDRLRSTVRSTLNAASTPRNIVILRDLPMCGPGKHDRRALRAQLSREGHVDSADSRKPHP